jgi:hypothetical protein
LYGAGTANNYLAGKLVIGKTSVSTFALDVNGTARVSGDLTVSKNQNAGTRFDVINTTSGTGSYAEYRIQAGTGSASLGKFSGTTTAYKFINANDSYFSNFTNGDIGFLNDFATGNIKFGAGGSSTAHMTIKANGSVRYQPMATPASSEAGDVYYDSSTNKLRCYNGTSWNDLF